MWLTSTGTMLVPIREAFDIKETLKKFEAFILGHTITATHIQKIIVQLDVKHKKPTALLHRIFQEMSNFRYSVAEHAH